MSVLDDPSVKHALRQAWLDSFPATDASHEEGGFICQTSSGSLVVRRWPKGAQNEIRVPEHAGGMVEKMPIIATFHTHPNSGPHFIQEPSPTDRRAVRDDPDLAHAQYEGEYVISNARIYLIRRDGEFHVVCATPEVLQLTV